MEKRIGAEDINNTAFIPPFAPVISSHRFLFNLSEAASVCASLS